MVDLDQVKRSNPLGPTVERLTGAPIVRQKVSAPWRSDGTPSVHIYDDGHWYDFGEGVGGDVIDFVGRFYFGAGYNAATHFQDVVDRLGGLDIAPARTPQPERLAAPKPKPKLKIDMADVRRWHDTMPPARREYWYARGLMDPIVDQHLLGWDGRRYTIPHLYRNVPFGVKRRRDDHNPDGIDAKYICVANSRAGIFNAEVLATEPHVIVCEGEIDCLLLNQYGYPAVSGTAGAATWKAEWARFFAGVPRVTLLFDNDEAGRIGARGVWQTMRRAKIKSLPDGIKDIGDLIENYDWPITWMKENLS
jgi:hypothetical protein